MLSARSTNTRWDRDLLRVAWCCSTRARKSLALRLAAVGLIATSVCPLVYLRPSRERRAVAVEDAQVHPPQLVEAEGARVVVGD